MSWGPEEGPGCEYDSLDGFFYSRETINEDLSKEKHEGQQGKKSSLCPLPHPLHSSIYPSIHPSSHAHIPLPPSHLILFFVKHLYFVSP